MLQCVVYTIPERVFCQGKTRCLDSEASPGGLWWIKDNLEFGPWSRNDFRMSATAMVSLVNIDWWAYEPEYQLTLRNIAVVETGVPMSADHHDFLIGSPCRKSHYSYKSNSELLDVKWKWSKVICWKVPIDWRVNSFPRQTHHSVGLCFGKGLRVQQLGIAGTNGRQIISTFSWIHHSPTRTQVAEPMWVSKENITGFNAQHDYCFSFVFPHTKRGGPLLFHQIHFMANSLA